MTQDTSLHFSQISYYDSGCIRADRNPQGARGLRVYAASVVVDDATASTSSAFLASTSQDPGSRPFLFWGVDS